MRVRDVLDHALFERAVLRAGEAGLSRDVVWVHVVEEPDAARWVRQGQLLLTTGHGLVGGADREVKVIEELARAGVSGVVLAVPTYFSEFSQQMVEVGDRLGLPLIELPWEVPFVDVTEALHRIVLSEQYSVARASEQVHRKLTQAAASFRGLQDLAQVLGDLLRRAVLIEAVDGGVLAAYREPQLVEDEIRAVTIATGWRAPEYLDHLRTVGLLDEVNQGIGPLRIPGSADGGIAARVACPVRLANETVASLWIIEGEEPLSELDLRAAEHGATVAALHISHQQQLWQTEHRLGATLLDTLLELDSPPGDGLIERARLAGLGDTTPWRLLLIAFDYQLPPSADDVRQRDQVAARLRQCLLRSRGPVLLTSHLQHVVALSAADVDLNDLVRRAGLTQVTVLASDPASTLDEVRKHYLNLQAMLPHVGSVGLYTQSDLLLPRVLAGDVLAQRELEERMLGPLSRVRGGEALRRTLEALCDTGFKLNETATGLEIHISTLRYRLDRLRQLIGHDLEDPSIRFLFQLTFAISKFREPGSAQRERSSVP